MAFIKEGIFNKIVSNYETKRSETTCIEVTSCIIILQDFSEL